MIAITTRSSIRVKPDRRDRPAARDFGSGRTVRKSWDCRFKLMMPRASPLGGGRDPSTSVDHARSTERLRINTNRR